MKRNLLKTMLAVFAAIPALSNMQASETTATVKMTYVNYSAGDTSYGEIATGSTAIAGYNKISGGIVGFGQTGWGVNYITYIQVDASGIEGVITGASLSLEVSGATDGKRQCTYGVGYNSSTWSSDLTYNTADKSITTVGNTYKTSTSLGTTFETCSFDISDALVGDEDKVVTLLVYETAAAGGYIKNPSVTVTYLSAGETTNYTVKYVCDGVEVKTSTSGIGAIGSTYTLTENDKASCFYNDKKYVYDSDDAASVTLADGVDNVITVTFREADKYSYKVNAVSGSTVLKELVSGTQYEGESARAFYTKAFLLDGKWYMTTGNSSYPTYAKDFTAAGEANVEFTESDIAYFAEIEDLTPSLDWAGYGTIYERYSNGKTARLTKEAYVATDQISEGGFYSLTLCARNKSGSQTANIPIGIKDADGKITVFDFTFADNWGTSACVARTLDNVPIPAGYSLVLYNNTLWNSNLELDYLYLKKTGDLTQEVSVSAAGLATFCSKYGVDFSTASNVAAYKAVASGSTVTLTKVTTAAAGEGVLLRSLSGDATSETLPVLATATKAEDNALVGTLTDIYVLEDDGTNINYVLSKERDIVGFFKAAADETGTKVGAGKAYLPIAKVDAAKGVTFVFDNDVTGISEIATDVKRTADDAVYTLSGVRVKNPSKGLYIVNGKKMIVK